MTSLCVIPARGGSQAVPCKNLRRVGGRALVARAVESGLAAHRLDHVIVSTDHQGIADEARRSGAEVITRPADLAGADASSEAALLHAVHEHANAAGHMADVLVMLQCTSPFIDPADIDRAVGMVVTGGYDSVFSAIASHEFLWRISDDGVVGVNHDWRVRERRQDRDVEFRESGAIYVMRVAGFLESQHRFFGRVGICEVSQTHGLEIDDEDDLRIAQHLAGALATDSLAGLDPALVTALVMDFDGVHTDNRAVVDQEGMESVRVSRADGLGLAALKSAGMPMLILSTEQNPVVNTRAQKLGIDCLLGVDDKVSALRKWAEESGVDPAGIAYVGNDTNDLGCLELVGFPIVVSDAEVATRYSGAMVTRRRGGDGALREVTDRLLRPPGPPKAGSK